MKHKLYLMIAFTFIVTSRVFAQSLVLETAVKDAALVPAKDTEVVVDDTKACAIFNKSTSRTINVRIEQSVMEANYLEKKIITVEKLGPREQKFVGYAGCEPKKLGEKCVGYKISCAYYEESPIVTDPKQKDNKDIAGVVGVVNNADSKGAIQTN